MECYFICGNFLIGVKIRIKSAFNCQISNILRINKMSDIFKHLNNILDNQFYDLYKPIM